jgi:predicted transcriptional regulator
MDTFNTPVREFMISPVRTIMESGRANDAEQAMSAWGISALAVVDRNDAMIGVLSRTDLLRAGRVRSQNGRRRKTLTLPQVAIRELMTPNVQIVAPDMPMSEAARRMVRDHIHRLYVSEDRLAVGVISTKEMMRAVAEARLAAPLSEFMHESIVMIRASDPLALAIDRLNAAHHVGLVVVDDGWPVGAFTQADALGAREAPADDRVDAWMDPRFICLPMATPLFRAAEQALATRARRVLAVDASGMRGILTGTDFARVAAQSSTGR